MGEDELKTNHPGAGLRGGWYVKKQIMASKFLVSVERLELSTNGLKGQGSKTPSPIQWPAVFAVSIGRSSFKVHWMLFLQSSQHGNVQWISSHRM
jgi:hypothetical protein